MKMILLNHNIEIFNIVYITGIVPCVGTEGGYKAGIFIVHSSHPQHKHSLHYPIGPLSFIIDWKRPTFKPCFSHNMSDSNKNRG